MTRGQTDPTPGALDSAPIAPGGILVHIGPPKTGTTSIQNACDRQRDELAGQGVHYAGSTRQPLAAVHAVLGRPILGHRVPSAHEWRVLVREIHRAHPARVLLSSEALALADAPTIRRIADDLGPSRVHVVVTLRSLVRILPSSWLQSVQSGTVASYDAWLQTILTSPGGVVRDTFWMQHAHHRLVARWAEVVGAKQTSVIVAADGDHGIVVGAFERLLGLRSGTLVSDPANVNRSLTLPEAAVVQALTVAMHEAGLDGRGERHVRAHATQWMKRRQPSSAEGRPATPAWAIDEISRISDEIVGGIRALGVPVIGELSDLSSPGGGPEVVPVEPDVVAPEIAASLATGILGAPWLQVNVTTRDLLVEVARRARSAVRRRIG